MICEKCNAEIMSGLQEMTATEIIQKACQFYQIDIKDLIGKKRNAYLIYSRHQVMDMLKRYKPLNLTLKGIGYLMGKRDHTTVLHAMDNVNKFNEIYPDYRENYRKLHVYCLNTEMYL